MEILIPEYKIERRVRAMAHKISEEHKESGNDLPRSFKSLQHFVRVLPNREMLSLDVGLVSICVYMYTCYI